METRAAYGGKDADFDGIGHNADLAQERIGKRALGLVCKQNGRKEALAEFAKQAIMSEAVKAAS
jgi:hypothetical protein